MLSCSAKHCCWNLHLFGASPSNEHFSTNSQSMALPPQFILGEKLSCCTRCPVSLYSPIAISSIAHRKNLINSEITCQVIRKTNLSERLPLRVVFPLDAPCCGWSRMYVCVCWKSFPFHAQHPFALASSSDKVGETQHLWLGGWLQCGGRCHFIRHHRHSGRVDWKLTKLIQMVFHPSDTPFPSPAGSVLFISQLSLMRVTFFFRRTVWV